MSERAPETRQHLLGVATDLFRRQGFVATSVDAICSAADVTKGAFFHYFKSKEALAEACLERWDQSTIHMIENAPFQSVADPIERLTACMDFLIGFFTSPGLLKSCLAGTTLQEVAESHPNLRDAAHRCILSGRCRFQALLEAAAKHRGKTIDSEALAGLWMATLQGSILLAKGSQDDGIIRTSLQHIRNYIASMFSEVRN